MSRQVIVGDIALLRAAGNEIIATPRGYCMRTLQSGILRTVACVHTRAQIEAELNIFVDNGCSVLDVIIEHPVYGQLTGELRISSRFDVTQFVERVMADKAAPLSSLTGGIHIHNLICPSQEAFDRACEGLRQQGYLYLEDPENDKI